MEDEIYICANCGCEIAPEEVYNGDIYNNEYLCPECYKRAFEWAQIEHEQNSMRRD